MGDGTEMPIGKTVSTLYTENVVLKLFCVSKLEKPIGWELDSHANQKDIYKPFYSRHELEIF